MTSMNARPADTLAIALAQVNPVVGDVSGNAAKVRAVRAQASDADLILFPELFIAGYPPEDLVLKPAFQAACRAAIEALARETADNGPAMIVGTPWVEDGKLYTKSEAGLRVQKLLGGFHKLLYAFIVVPAPIRDAVYDYIARHRYEWYGKKDECMIPTPDIKSRFLE